MTSLHALTPLVLACREEEVPRGLRAWTMKARAGSGDFMTLLKENESEIWGFQVLHRISLLATPQKGSVELTCTLKVPIWNVALGNSYAYAIYLFRPIYSSWYVLAQAISWYSANQECRNLYSSSQTPRQGV